MKRRIALTAMLALVASMFGAVPSRAADLVLTFPTVPADFLQNEWSSVSDVSGLTPGVSGGNGGTIRATVSAGTSGKLRLQITAGISAATSYTLADFDADDSTGLETISFQGNVSDVNDALASMNFRRITDTGTNTLTASVTEGTGLVFGTNYYEVYNSSDVIGGSSSISAENAFKFAASRKLDSTAVGISCQGYLATITSANEQEFAYERVKTASWIGASDEFSYVNAATGATTYANQTASEGKFYWVTGPERGTQISNNNGSAGRDRDGVYQNWNGEEPNNSGTGEQAVQMLSGGAWNDLKVDSTSVAKFIVEYGGVRTTETHTQTYTDVSFDNAGEVGTVATCTPAIVAGTQTASFSALSSVPAGAPTGAAATVTAGVTSAALTWSAPGSAGGSAITGYKIEVNDGTTWTTASASTGTDSTSYTVTGLTAGSSYTFRVSAINAISTSSASTASSSVTIVAIVPDAPTGVAAAVSAGVTSASLTWTGPASTGGSDITGYKIEKNDSSSWTTVVADTASTLTSYTVTGLAVGGTYTFRVSAINVVGLSTTAASSQVTISPAPAPPPYSGPVPTGVSAATASAGDKITISGRGLGVITSVTIDGVNIKVSNQSATSFEITIPEGLLPGKKDIRILSSQGNLTYQSAIEILEQEPKTSDLEPEAIEAPVLDKKVNAGSFKGHVALYALNLEGHRLSAKVGNDWVIVESIPESTHNLYRHVEFTGVGYEVQVRIFIDRELEATIPLLTK